MNTLLDPHNVSQIVGRSPNRKDVSNTNTSSPVRPMNGLVAIDMSMDINRNKTKPADQPDVQLWGISLNYLSPLAQFLTLCFGVFFFYLAYGYLQELIFRLEGFRPFGWYLTLVQFAYYTIFGLIEKLFTTDKTRKVPLRAYGLLAFLTVATMGLSNSSLGYLNYPTQVIFKCCKLIPVLIGSIIIQDCLAHLAYHVHKSGIKQQPLTFTTGKKYGLLDFLACLCMSVGLIFFTLADSKVSPTFSTYGVTLISLALCADAVIGNVQEKTMKQYNGSNSEMVLYSYGIGFLYILFGELASGEIVPAFNFCLSYPLQTYGYAFLFSVFGYLGVNVVLVLLKFSGALVAVTVTTCRKAITMILSFVFFAKPFTIQYVLSGVIVLIGIYISIYSKNRVTWNAKIYTWIQRYIFRNYVPIRGSEHVV